MKDAHALNSYVATRSDEAFGELARRYVDLVYSAALRQSRDPHLADDITQAVFIVLSKKAHTIRDASLLPGWLIRTTRYAAFNAVKLESRRRHHEHEAAAMASDSYSADESAPNQDLIATLDEKLAHLSDTDRTAIVLRFSRGMSINEIAQEMNLSADAAQKRLARAIEKLRGLFARKGLIASADAIGLAIGAQSLVAPHTLLPAIQSAAQSSKALQIAHSAMRMMSWTPAKVVSAVAAAITIAAGGAILLVQSPPTPAGAAPPAPTTVLAPATRPATAPSGKWLGLFGARKEFTYPMKFPNADLVVGHAVAKGYECALDDKVKRESESAAVLFSNDPKPAPRTEIMITHPADALRGKRIRVSAYLKTETVEGWTGLGVIVYGNGGRVFAADVMSTRPISGTTDFKQYESIVDVPQEATAIMFGTAIWSPGIVWSDGFQIEIVGKDVPTTDDQIWHTFCWRATAYTAEVDENCKRNGHPTTRMSSSKGVPGHAGFYDYAIRNVEQYRGKRIKLTMWLKSEGVVGPAGPHLNINGPNFQRIASEGQAKKRPINGTIDWKQYEAIADVPANAEAIFPGITMNGKGTIWIDDVQLEIVDDKK